MEELIDVLYENGIPTGQVLTRKEIHGGGYWHRSIIVLIINEKNEVLLQQRSKNKDKNANMWDVSVAGHISSGQDALSAAAREINEEVSIDLGYHVDIKDFRYMYSFRKEQKFADDFIERQFYDLFVLRKNDLDIENITMQEEEVQSVKFCSISELRQLRKTKDLVPREEVYTVLEKYIFSL